MIVHKSAVQIATQCSWVFDPVMVFVRIQLPSFIQSAQSRVQAVS
jgi:hypothetical protein